MLYTAEELQEKIFERRYKRDGYVNLTELPTIHQLSIFLALDPNGDYTHLSQEEAQKRLRAFYNSKSTRGKKRGSRK